MSSIYRPACVLVALAISAAKASEDWCTFFTESYCENRSGGVDYDVTNDGIFQNGGPYFSCRSSTEFSLFSYPPGDSAGDNPDNCIVFNKASECFHLDDMGYHTGDGGYYRITTSKTCSASKRDEMDNETLADAPVVEDTRVSYRDFKEKRDANYLTFFNDPACQEQSGGVSYSVQNQGCFENGGAYFRFPGADDDWHIEQWTGTDNYACAITMEHCANAKSDIFANGGCIHVDDTGLQSGYGSYKIARQGCP